MQTTIIIVIVVVVVVVIIGVSLGIYFGTKSQTSPNCSNDQTCSGFQVCTDGQCQNKKCDDNLDCDGFNVCSSGECQAKTCSSNQDCDGSLLCTDNQCTSTCATNTDCPSSASEQCVKGECHVVDCRSSTDCNGPNFDCVLNECVPKACATTNDCSGYDVCTSKQCQPGDCEGSDDCKGTSICSHGQCQAKVCNEDTDCPIEEFCNVGECHARIPVVPVDPPVPSLCKVISVENSDIADYPTCFASMKEVMANPDQYPTINTYSLENVQQYLNVCAEGICPCRPGTPSDFTCPVPRPHPTECDIISAINPGDPDGQGITCWERMQFITDNQGNYPNINNFDEANVQEFLFACEQSCPCSAVQPTPSGFHCNVDPDNPTLNCMGVNIKGLVDTSEVPASLRVVPASIITLTGVSDANTRTFRVTYNNPASLVITGDSEIKLELSVNVDGYYSAKVTITGTSQQLPTTMTDHITGFMFTFDLNLPVSVPNDLRKILHFGDPAISNCTGSWGMLGTEQQYAEAWSHYNTQTSMISFGGDNFYDDEMHGTRTFFNIMHDYVMRHNTENPSNKLPYINSYPIIAVAGNHDYLTAGNLSQAALQQTFPRSYIREFGQDTYMDTWSPTGSTPGFGSVCGLYQLAGAVVFAWCDAYDFQDLYDHDVDFKAKFDVAINAVKVSTKSFVYISHWDDSTPGEGNGVTNYEAFRATLGAGLAIEVAKVVGVVNHTHINSLRDHISKLWVMGGGGWSGGHNSGTCADPTNCSASFIDYQNSTAIPSGARVEI